MAGGDTRGSLDRYPLPRLLCFLQQKSFTGTLRIEQDPAPAEVLVHRGVPVALYPQPMQALTRLLLERGRLDFDQYTELMSGLSTKTSEDELLQDKGGLSADEVHRGRKLLLFRDLCRLFQLSDAPFVLSADVDPRLAEHVESGVAIEPLYLVYHGIRNAYDDARLRDELSGLGGHAVRLAASGEELVQRFGFGEEDAELLACLRRGYWKLSDLVTESGTAPAHVLMVVYALWAAGALEAAPRDTVECLLPTRAPAVTPPTPAPTPQRKPPSSVTLRAASKKEQPADAAEEKPAAARQPATPRPTPRESQRVTSTGEHRAKVNNLPTTGAFAAVRAPQSVLRKALRAATRLRAEGNLKPEAVDVLDELERRLEEMDGQSPFELLDLSLDATTVDVKKSYMKLVRRIHPDRLAGIGLEPMAEAVDALFKRITEAHQTLSDPDNIEEARRIYSGEKSPDDADAARRLIEAEVDFQKGEVFLRKNDLKQAEEYFRKAVEGNPDEGEHLALLAWTLYQQFPKQRRTRKRPEIRKMLAQAVELSPRCARGHYFLGKLHQEDGKMGSAKDCFQKAVQCKRDYIEAQRELRLMAMRSDREGQTKRKSTLLDMFRKK